MSANFDGTAYLLSAVPQVTGYPFTVGAWVYPRNATTNSPFWYTGNGLSGVSGRHWFIDISASAFRLASLNADTTRSASAGTPVANEWHFVLARCVSATNRIITVLMPNGSVAEGVSSISSGPTGITETRIGAGSTLNAEWDGLVSRHWIADADIQADGGSTQVPIFRVLARSGPFAIPHIARSIVEYRSFRCGLTSNQDDPSDIYSRGVPLAYTDTGGVLRGPEPPAADNYLEPLPYNAPMVLV